MNDFLKNLEPAQVREIVDCMYSKVYSRLEIVINEGEPGDALYVIAGKECSRMCNLKGELNAKTNLFLFESIGIVDNM